MNVSAAISLARRLMNENGLGHWILELSRAKRTAGRCFHEDQKIELSSEYISVNNEESVQNVIVHEIAHALVGPGHNHDYIWKRKHISLGGNGSQYYTPLDSVMVPKRFTGTCGCSVSRKTNWEAHRLSHRLLTNTCVECDQTITWYDNTERKIVQREITRDYTHRYKGWCDCNVNTNRHYRAGKMTDRLRNGTCRNCRQPFVWYDNKEKVIVRRMANV